MQLIFKKKLYSSRSELVRIMLLEEKYNKSTIAECADVTPQTVQYLYKRMVDTGKIEDYYPKFIKLRKQTRLTRRKRNRC